MRERPQPMRPLCEIGDVGEVDRYDRQALRVLIGDAYVVAGTQDPSISSGDVTSRSARRIGRGCAMDGAMVLCSFYILYICMLDGRI